MFTSQKEASTGRTRFGGYKKGGERSGAAGNGHQGGELTERDGWYFRVSRSTYKALPTWIAEAE